VTLWRCAPSKGHAASRRVRCMIHQCYFLPLQVPSLFQHDPYIPFGLEPRVNGDITLACPELVHAEDRLAVLEHAALLWHWRNRKDVDPWIGFTSYRQLDKEFPFVFKSRQHVQHELAGAEIVAWGLVRFPVSLSQQAELCHPGINEYLGLLFAAFGETIPREYHLIREGGFCNYWVMGRRTFDEYMRWFAPKMTWCMAHSNLPYARASPKSLSYVLERLFIVWYLTTRKSIAFIGGAAGLEREKVSLTA
jgi:hypothetical protein